MPPTTLNSEEPLIRALELIETHKEQRIPAVITYDGDPLYLGVSSRISATPQR